MAKLTWNNKNKTQPCFQALKKKKESIIIKAADYSPNILYMNCHTPLFIWCLSAISLESGTQQVPLHQWGLEYNQASSSSCENNVHWNASGLRARASAWCSLDREGQKAILSQTRLHVFQGGRVTRFISFKPMTKVLGSLEGSSWICSSWDLSWKRLLYKAENWEESSCWCAHLV